MAAHNSGALLVMISFAANLDRHSKYLMSSVSCLLHWNLVVHPHLHEVVNLQRRRPRGIMRVEWKSCEVAPISCLVQFGNCEYLVTQPTSWFHCSQAPVSIASWSATPCVIMDTFSAILGE